MPKCSSHSLLVLPPRAVATGRRFQRRALLIGVSQYPVAPGVPALPPLPGADRNPWLLAPELAARGFACELLLNEHATRDEIRRAVRALVIQARAGDVCVLAFSGHGFSLTGSGSPVAETGDFLYPYDSQTNGPIRSDELLCWLLPTESRVSLYCVIDACHAGAISNGPLARWRLPLWSRPWRGYRADPGGDTVQPDNTLQHVVLSACRDDERADYSSRTCGTFTRALVDVLARHRNATTRNVMLATALECAKRLGTSQHPLLRGPQSALDAEIFSSFRRSPGPASPLFAARRITIGPEPREALQT
jgi:hypothetical protein